VKRWFHFENISSQAARQTARGALAAFAAAAIALGAPPAAVAVGPRAGEPSPAVAPRATPAPIVLPDIPDLPEAEFYRALELSSRHGFPRGWFGIGLQCSDCSVSRDDSSGARVWSFEARPEISYVDPDGPAGKAGLRPGDKLTHVDGEPITSAEGGRRFGAVKPGDSVRWTYERDGKTFITTLTAQEHPDRAFLIDPAVSEELQQSLAELRTEQVRMREDRRRAFADQHVARSYERALRMAEEAQRSLERTQESLRRRGYVVAPEAPEPPEPHERRKLRYEGTVGDSQVEVHGTGSVVVRKDEHGHEELVITTPDATIRIRQKK